MAKYLIIGGCGFVGVNIAAALRRKGDEVLILDNLTYSQDENLAYLKSIDVEVRNGDVRDKDALEREISAGIDGVFHLASVVGIKNYLSSTRDLIDVNIYGAANVADRDATERDADETEAQREGEARHAHVGCRGLSTSA